MSSFLPSVFVIVVLSAFSVPNLALGKNVTRAGINAEPNIALRDISTRALSGTFSTVINKCYTAYISWSATQNEEKLTSKVTAKFYVKKTKANKNRSYNNLGAPVVIKIAGSSVHSADHTFDFPASSSVGTQKSLGSGSKTVTHNADGTKSVSISAKLESGINWGTVTVSGTAKLDAIPVYVVVTYNANGGSVSKKIKESNLWKEIRHACHPNKDWIHFQRVVYKIVWGHTSNVVDKGHINI